MKRTTYYLVFVLLLMIFSSAYSQSIVFKAEFNHYVDDLIDVDGDGILEFIVKGGAADTSYSFYDGKSLSLKYTIHGKVPLEEFYTGPSIHADYNRDGKIDMVFESTNPGTLWIIDVSSGLTIFKLVDPNETYFFGTPCLADLDNDGRMEFVILGAKALIYSTKVPTTSLARASGTTLRNYKLNQNYPNPFNPATTIEYEVQAKAHVKIRIYDISGQIVRTLVDQDRFPGTFTTKWDGKTDNGTIAASGTYFYQFQADDFVSSKKMILLR